MDADDMTNGGVAEQGTPRPGEPSPIEPSPIEHSPAEHGPIGPGRVAVVTGAASGIGLGLAERFAAEGMSVVMADVEGPALAKAAAGLGARIAKTKGGAPVLPVVTDVSD